MIISHKHRFIFIKTMKTASTSLEVFLSQYCGDRGVVTPIYPPVTPHQAQNYQSQFNPLPELWLRQRYRQPLQPAWSDYRTQNRFYNHLPAWAIRARVPRSIWRTYFTFCVERNPWDKTLSYYHMRRYDSKQPLTLDQHLKGGDFCLNHPYYTDIAGDRIIVDRVVRYETLSQELKEVCQRLNIPFSGSLDIRAKADRRNDYRPYRQIYTPQQRQLIERIFAKEIELHGYQF